MLPDPISRAGASLSEARQNASEALKALQEAVSLEDIMETHNRNRSEAEDALNGWAHSDRQWNMVADQLQVVQQQGPSSELARRILDLENWATATSPSPAGQPFHRSASPPAEAPAIHSPRVTEPASSRQWSQPRYERPHHPPYVPNQRQQHGSPIAALIEQERGLMSAQQQSLFERLGVQHSSSHGSPSRPLSSLSLPSNAYRAGGTVSIAAGSPSGLLSLEASSTRPNAVSSLARLTDRVSMPVHSSPRRPLGAHDASTPRSGNELGTAALETHATLCSRCQQRAQGPAAPEQHRTLLSLRLLARTMSRWVSDSFRRAVLEWKFKRMDHFKGIAESLTEQVNQLYAAGNANSSGLRGTLAKVTERYRAVQGTHKDLEKEVAKLRQGEEKMASLLEFAEEDKVVLRENAELAKKQMEMVQEAYNELEDELEELNQQMASERAKALEATSSVAAKASAKVHKLQRELNEAQDEIDAANLRFDEAATEFDRAEERIGELEAEVAGLQGVAAAGFQPEDYEQLALELQELKRTQRQEVLAAMEESQEEVAELEGRLGAVLSEQAELKLAASQWEAKYEAKKAKAKELKKEEQVWRVKAGALDDQLSSANRKIEELLKERREMIEQLRDT